MKILILKDKKIREDHITKIRDEFAAFIKKWTGIGITYITEEFDFSRYPTVTEKDGDQHLTDEYLKKLTDDVFAKHGNLIDHVVAHIHRDNWRMAGIWGTNYSNIFRGYQLHICRFDSRNLANAFGTLYHEIMHSFDVFIKTYTGGDINKLLGVPWDKFIVHGGRPDAEGSTEWKYIRHQDNTKALKAIAPHLKLAYEKRHTLYMPKGSATAVLKAIEQFLKSYKIYLNQSSTLKK